MTNNCEILVVYQQQPKIMIYKDNLFAIKDYDNLRQNIINKSSKQKNEIKKIAVKSGDKFILELEENLPGITCIFNPETFNFVQSKALENNVQKIKVHIIKVDKYPDWKPPQILKILEKTLKSAYDEVIKEIKTDLTPVNLENGGRVFKKERKEEKEMSNETYVSLYDYHLRTFFSSETIRKDLKNKGFINSEGFIMYDPEHRNIMRTLNKKKKKKKIISSEEIMDSIKGIDVPSNIKDKEIDAEKRAKQKNVPTDSRLPVNKELLSMKTTGTKKKKKRGKKNRGSSQGKSSDEWGSSDESDSGNNSGNNSGTVSGEEDDDENNKEKKVVLYLIVLIKKKAQ